MTISADVKFQHDTDIGIINKYDGWLTAARSLVYVLELSWNKVGLDFLWNIDFNKTNEVAS